jgi:hypothetical protein
MLREFKFVRDCADDVCSSLLFQPVTTKTNPAGELFDPDSTHAQAAAFRAECPSLIGGLLADTAGGISLSVRDEFNMAQSAASGPYADELDYNLHLGEAYSPLRDALAAELVESPLEVEHVLERARTQTCAGCHRRSRGADLGGGLVWPADLGFVHVSEKITEEIDGAIYFGLSDALKDEFLPARKRIMEDFLDDKPRPPSADPNMPLAGHRHHG